MSEVTHPWKSQKEGFQESLSYLKGRMEGSIKSFRTPWAKFNDATTDGIEWNSMTVIGGRPGSGKTLLKDQIIREGFPLNPGQDFRVLEFQFEMLARVSAIREYSSILGKSYKYLCSADRAAGKLKGDDLQKCFEYAKERIKYPVDIIEEPCTVTDMKKIITQYMEHHKKKTVITLDHSMLIKLGAAEKNQLEMVYNLGTVLTQLKRKYPIAFIILSQLNRNVENPSRNEDGTYGNYILTSDIFGGDALLQHADTLVGLNVPAKQKIRFYGPDRYIIADETVMVMHYLKCRNGDTRMSFFKTQFEQMKVVEMPTPPVQEKRISTK
jgi:replicative DNA helicase